jgi:hypothetical protein
MGKAQPNFICIIERVYKAAETGKHASALITVSSQNAHSNRANESPGSTNGWMSASKRIATTLGDPCGQRAVAGKICRRLKGFSAIARSRWTNILGLKAGSSRLRSATALSATCPTDDQR